MGCAKLIGFSVEGRRTLSSNPRWKGEREENSLAAELPWPEGSLAHGSGIQAISSETLLILTRGVELGHVASRTSPVPNRHVLRRTTTEELTFVSLGHYWSSDQIFCIC